MIITPSSTTAAAVSSHDVSIPRILILWIISLMSIIFESVVSGHENIDLGECKHVLIYDVNIICFGYMVRVKLSSSLYVNTANNIY